MAFKPIMPRDKAAPTGQAGRERSALADFKRRYDRIGAVWQAVLDRIDFAEIIQTNARRYEFRTMPQVLAALLAEAGRMTDEILQEGGEDQLWFSLEYALPAYEQGAAISWRNLGAQSQTYRRQFPQLLELIASAPYQRRIGLLRAREFEEMQALSGLTKANMGRALAQGLASGVGPLETARLMSEQLDISRNRANLIARTEINQALRTARLDEAQDAQDRLGVQTRMMHLSALSPTTRPNHAGRHGKLYTIEEARDWWASTEACNCKCSTTEVLVDENGQPLSPDFVRMVQQAGADYFERLAA